MGQIVSIAEARARKARGRGAERTPVRGTLERDRGLEFIEHGGWYHGEAIRAARKGPDAPH